MGNANEFQEEKETYLVCLQLFYNALDATNVN